MHLKLAAIGFFVIVAILIVCLVVHLWKEHREARRIQNLVDQARDLHDRANQGDRKAEDALVRRYVGQITELGYVHYDTWLKDTFDTAGYDYLKSILSKVEYRRTYENFQKMYARWQTSLEAGTFQERIFAGSDLHWALNCREHDLQSRICSELGVSLEAIAAKLLELTRHHAAQLWQQAQSSREAYLELRLLLLAVRKGNIPGHEDYVRGLPSSVKLQWPEGWNEKTAEYLDDPHFVDFDTQMMQPGEAHRRAIEVRRNPDWIEAAIILAYLRSNRLAHEEVGEQLRNELQEQVVAHRQSLVSQTS